MARGAPRLWGAIVGVPLVLVGGGILQTGGFAEVPDAVGYPFLLLGITAICLGTYVERVAPEQLDLEPIETFHPSQLGAYLLSAAALPALVTTLYLLFGTRVPYIWPTLTFTVFVVLVVKALVRYWQNSLTTYYVTEDARIISEYRFLSLKRSSVQTDSVQSVVRKQSLLETLTGLGSVTVRSPSGNISFRDLSGAKNAERLLNSLIRD